jgi:nitroreductase
MLLSRPVADLIVERFSCRAYARTPIPEDTRRTLAAAAGATRTGPFGSALRFQLIAAAADDSSLLRGLGTYGFIRDPAGFIAGAARPGDTYLEDYGYAMETLILAATDLGMGTCWLGGFFTRGSFAERIGLQGGERIPAVVSLGEIADQTAARAGALRRLVGGERRLPWERMMFDRAIGTPLPKDAAGGFSAALEMVRLAPSASNRQPWRIVRDGVQWHFFLSRTPGYRGGLAGKILRIEDIQRVDVGIAMCHFELTLRDSGLGGRWVRKKPLIRLPDPHTEYIATWESGG